MKNRRNLAVAAVTAAVVTTALVGTTLPDLVTNKATSSVQEQLEDRQNEVVTTELPDVPSAKDISAAKGSNQATDQMIGDINQSLNQAGQRALELEAALQMEHQAALDAELEAEEADEAASEAEEAEELIAAQASEDYQEGETSAEDVLLSDDENALADAATEERLDEQAESDAIDSSQDAEELRALADQAQEVNTGAQETLSAAEEQSAQDLDELGETLLELLEAAAELEGYDNLEVYLAIALGNEDLTDEDGNIDKQKLVWHVAGLRDSQTSAEPADSETAEGSADGEEGEASPSAEPEASESPSPTPTPTEEARTEEPEAEEAAEEEVRTASHSLDQYLPGTRGLVGELAELEGETLDATFQRLINDPDFTTEEGLLDHSAVNAEVNRLAPEPEPEPSPTPTQSSSPTSSPSPTQSSTPSPSSSPSPTQTASGPSLSQYREGTRGLVERIAELEEAGVEATFERLINDSNFTDSNGHLDHAALQREVNRLAPAPSPTPSPTQSSSSGSSSNSGSSSSGSSGSSGSGSSSSSTPSHSLSQYQSGTRGLVEQIAQLEGESANEAFNRLASDSDFTDSNGILDHAALQREVNRLSPSESSSSSGSSSNSGSSNSQSSGSSGGQTQPANTSGGGSGSASIAVNWAVNKVNEPGTHYVLGGNGPKAYDCSSLTQQALAQAGVSIPRTADAQFRGGQAVSLDNLQPGDLVFWTSGGRAHHVAIYIGNGQVAHARNPSAGLSVTSVYYAYDNPDPTARRYF